MITRRVRAAIPTRDYVTRAGSPSQRADLCSRPTFRIRSAHCPSPMPQNRFCPPPGNSSACSDVGLVPREFPGLTEGGEGTGRMNDAKARALWRHLVGHDFPLFRRSILISFEQVVDVKQFDITACFEACIFGLDGFFFITEVVSSSSPKSIGQNRMRMVSVVLRVELNRLLILPLCLGCVLFIGGTQHVGVFWGLAE